MKDPNHLLKVEKAISEKYGEETIQDPRKTWDDEKEKEYLKQIKKIAEETKPKEKIEVEGVLLPKKLFTKESKRTCPVCNVYSSEGRDDLYMAKFKCCYKCYIYNVEGREEKWLNKIKLQEKN